MTYYEFQDEVNSYEAAKAEAGEFGFEPVGIDIVYVNAKGEEKSLTIRNPSPSTQFAGCIDADCFSYYRADEWGVISGKELDIAITSRKTFRLSRIMSASVASLSDETT